MILDINDFINKFRPLKILIAGNDYDLSELDLRDKEVIHIDKPWDAGINRKKYSGLIYVYLILKMQCLIQFGHILQ